MSRVRTRVVPCIAGLFALLGAGIVPVASASASATRTLRQGMHGPDVRNLQTSLSRAGFATPATGTFSAATQRTVQRWQRFYQLRPDGAVDAAQIRELAKIVKLDAAGVDSGATGGVAASATSGGGGLTGGPKIRTRQPSRRASKTSDPTTALNNPVLAPVKRDGGSKHLGERTLRKGMHGHDVRVLQSYLTLAGYSTPVDGEFGPSTLKNVIRFEQAAGLATNGVMTYAQSLALRQAVAKATATSGPVGQATLNSDGTVTAPAGAPQVVQQVIASANQIITKPYIYGGGHGKFNDAGYDCSGAVSYALHGGGLLSSPLDSTGLESWGSAGKGQWITVYANAGHAFVVVAGLAFDTAHYGSVTPSGSGPRWLSASNTLSNLKDGTGGYTARHPSGL